MELKDPFFADQGLQWFRIFIGLKWQGHSPLPMFSNVNIYNFHVVLPEATGPMHADLQPHSPRHATARLASPPGSRNQCDTGMKALTQKCTRFMARGNICVR